MENNQVILSLSNYNRLRDFHTNITDGKVLRYYDPYDQHEEEIGYITTDKTVKELIADKKTLSGRISELDHIIWELKNPQPEEPTLKDVKKMSIRAFKKWRRE